MNAVYRSTHKQNRWLSSGPYRQQISINWNDLITDIIIGSSLGAAILVFGLRILQGVAV